MECISREVRRIHEDQTEEASQDYRLLKMTDDDDPEIFFKSLRRVVRELKDIRVTTEEDRMIDKVLDNLPTRYALVQHDMNKNPDMSLADIERVVKQMYNTDVALETRTDGVKSVTMVATNSSRRCRICKRAGHIAKECKRRNSGKKLSSGDKKWCSVHNTTNHNDTECRAQSKHR